MVKEIIEVDGKTIVKTGDCVLGTVATRVGAGHYMLNSHAVGQMKKEAIQEILAEMAVEIVKKAYEDAEPLERMDALAGLNLKIDELVRAEMADNKDMLMDYFESYLDAARKGN